MAVRKLRWRSKLFDERTIFMLKEVERLSGVRLNIVQGSYSRGKISTRGLSKRQIMRVIKAMRQVGFVSWYRTRADGFQPHIHGIAVGAPNLGSVAKDQIAQAKAGKNGLRTRKRDPHSSLGLPVTTWERYNRDKKKRLAAKAKPAHKKAPAHKRVLPALPKYPGRQGFKRGAKGDHVKVVQVAHGHKPTGIMSAADIASVKRMQRRNRSLWPADGIVGPRTYARYKKFGAVAKRWRF